jgi:hypothetical protein
VTGVDYNDKCSETLTSGTVEDSPVKTRLAFAWRVHLVVPGATQTSFPASMDTLSSSVGTQITGTQAAKTSDASEAPGTPSGRGHNDSKIIIGVIVPIVVLLIIAAALLFLRRIRRPKGREQIQLAAVHEKSTDQLHEMGGEGLPSELETEHKFELESAGN